MSVVDKSDTDVVPVTLRGLLSDLIATGMDPDDAAQQVADEADRGLIADMALPSLRILARKVARETARAHEVLARQGMDDLGLDAASAARKHLVDQKFALPDGTWVDWAYATHNQHIERARWMRQHAEASIKDAELHEKAAALIKKHRAKCLADTPSYALPQELSA